MARFLQKDRNAITLLIGVALALAVGACSSTANHNALIRAQPTASESTKTATAQGIVDTLLRAQKDGQPKAAAYVETTWGKYSSILSSNERTSGLPPLDTDEVLVVKVAGNFPHFNRGFYSGATMIVVIYDERLQTDVETESCSCKAPDVPGSGDEAYTGKVPSDLRLLGTPISLRV